MKKFSAKIKFVEQGGPEVLVRAFFTDFNPESSLNIRGSEARMEIVFDNPPMAIAEAMTRCCCIDEFKYGKSWNEFEPEKVPEEEKAEEGPETNPQEVSEEEVETQAVQKESKTETENSPEERDSENEIIEEKQIEEPKVEPELVSNQLSQTNTDEPAKSISKSEKVDLREIAAQSESFEDFLHRVASSMNMKKQQEVFINLAITVSELAESDIGWKSIEQRLKEKGIVFTESDKILFYHKMKENAIKALPFLKEINTYKDFFHKEKELENEETVDTLVDILNTMGLCEKTNLQQEWILEIANIGLSISLEEDEEKVWDNIFSLSNIPHDKILEARMTFASFVNEKRNGDKIKAIDFIADLKKRVE